MFTPDNTDGYDSGALESINSAFDEAWGAIKGRWQRCGSGGNADDVRKTLSEEILKAYDDRAGDAGAVAEAALRKMGHTVRRDAYSLEID